MRLVDKCVTGKKKTTKNKEKPKSSLHAQHATIAPQTESESPPKPPRTLPRPSMPFLTLLKELYTFFSCPTFFATQPVQIMCFVTRIRESKRSP